MDEPETGGSPPTPEESAKSRSLRERSAVLRTRYEQKRKTLEQQAEVLRGKNESFRIAYEAYDRDRRHAGSLLAGGLAYRLFIWMVPMALVLSSALGVIAQYSSHSTQEVAKSAGLAAALTAAVASAAEDTGKSSLLLLVIGLWAVLWAGKSVVKALRLLAGVAWQIRPARFTRSWLASAAFSGLAVVLLGTPVLLQRLYAGPFIVDLLVWIATPLLLGPAFAYGFDWLPHPDGPPWTAFLPGGWLLAFGLQFMRIATAVYFAGRLERVNDLYGALGIATVIMLWLFLIGRLVVAAMAVNAERWRATHPAPSEGSL